MEEGPPGDARMQEMELLRRRIQEAEQRAQEAEQRVQEADQRIQETERLRVEEGAEAEQRIQEAEQRIQEAEQLRVEVKRLLAGTYYSSIDEVWNVGAVDYTENDWEALRRSTCPLYYKTTVVEAQAIGNNPRNEPGLSRSSASGLNAAIWPVNIFGSLPDGEIAHLVPASSRNASLYDDVAAWTLALPAGSRRNVLQKAIHGSVPIIGGNRIANTGLKHSVFNKLRLPNQGELYDRKPCIMIVPVMTLDEVKGWNGGGYEALVMAGPHGETGISRVCAGMDMQSRGTEASDADIEVARSMLKQVLCGLARSLMREGRDLPDSQIEALNELKKPFQTPQTMRLQVPISSKRNLRVRKVSFSQYGGTEGVHPAPDPLLLTVKAAINWSWRHEQQILAGGELSDDDEASELSVMAEEQYLEWQQDMLRPKNRQDLAQGLGQPNGYQNVTTAN
jgi:hypothetical protein